MTNPMDEIFKRRLDQYELTTPMHLWDGIENHIGVSNHKQKESSRNRWPIIAVFLMFLSLALHQLFLDFTRVPEELNSFPIHSTGIAQSHHLEESINPRISNLSNERSTIGDSLLLQKQSTSLNLIFENSKELKPRVSTSPPSIDELSNAITHPLNNRINDKSRTITVAPIQELSSLPFLYEKEKITQDLKQSEPVLVFGPIQTLYFDLGSKDETIKKGFTIVPAKRMKKKIGLNVGFSAGVQWSSRTLSQVSEEYDTYVDLRSQTESTLPGYSSSLHSELIFPKGWKLRVGLNYSQINERFNYENDEELRFDQVSSIFDSDGVLLRTDSLFALGYRQKITYNRLRTLDFSAQLGYTQSFGKVSINLYAGPSFNFLFQKKGDLLSPDNFVPISFTDNLEESVAIFENTVGISVASSIQFEYSLTGRSVIFIEPYSQFYFKSFTNPEVSMVDQKYHVYGVSIGFKQRIF